MKALITRQKTSNAGNGLYRAKNENPAVAKDQTDKNSSQEATNRKGFRRAPPIIPAAVPASSGRAFAQPPFKESTAPGGRNNIELQIKINLNFNY